MNTQVVVEPQLLQFGRLRINLHRSEVIVNNKKIHCSDMEYEVLRFFAMHPNRVFSKEQLLRYVWGYEECGDVRTVTVHIRKLREKIEKDPSKPTLIKTIWGVGYRFDTIFSETKIG